MAYAALIRWSPWNNRIELPLLAMGMPMVGWLLNRGSRRMIPLAFVSIFGIYALAWLAIDDARPLVGNTTPSILSQHRADIYFQKRPDLRAPYQAAVAVLKAEHPSHVGLITNPDDWEYPFFALAPDHGAHITFFDARAEDWGSSHMPRPDLVLCTAVDDPACQQRPGWTVVLDGRVRVLKPS